MSNLLHLHKALHPTIYREKPEYTLGPVDWAVIGCLMFVVGVVGIGAWYFGSGI